jgi:hypothetical protein
MAIDPDQARHRAEQQFKKKQEQAEEGAVAMAQYWAGQRAVEEKTARLKALRLAREAAFVEARAKKSADKKG